MCDWVKSGANRIDPCMRSKIKGLDSAFKLFASFKIEILACCCGHGKYPETIIIRMFGVVREFYSEKIIPRKKRFYKRDSEGVYYVPELCFPAKERRNDKK